MKNLNRHEGFANKMKNTKHSTQMHDRRISTIIEGQDDLGDVDTHAVDWQLPPTLETSERRASVDRGSPIDTNNHECHCESPLIRKGDEKPQVAQRRASCCSSTKLDDHQAPTRRKSCDVCTPLRHHTRRKSVTIRCAELAEAVEKSGGPNSKPHLLALSHC